MDKPSAFNWRDLLVFGGMAIVVTFLAVWVVFNADPGTPASAKFLMCFVAAFFWGIYGALVIWRVRFINSFDFMTDDGIMVSLGKYRALESDIRTEINRTINKWSYTLDDIGAPIRSGALIRSERVYVLFQPGPFPHPVTHELKMMGFVYAKGNVAHVAYISQNQDVRETALFHELGHIIYGRHTNNWDCEKHHAFMGRHGLA